MNVVHTHPQQVTDPKGSAPMHSDPNTAVSTQAQLQLSGVSKRFGGLQAIDQVTIDLEPGIVTTLVGPNGAGKTTLFNTITGHIKPDSGTILWQGKSIVGLPPWKIARLGIARTFQDLRLFTHMTVQENVLAAMEHQSWLWQTGGKSAQKTRAEKVAHTLEITGLADMAQETANNLSYAERKFLSLARTLVSGADLWLLDEPASGLDPPSYDLFLKLLRDEVNRGITVCIIEHNLDIVVGISDKIAFLDQGRLIANGDPREVLENPELVAIYFGERKL